MSINNSSSQNFSQLTIQGPGDLLDVKYNNGNDFVICDADAGVVTMTGNLNVIGNITYTNTNTLSVRDPLIELANNNTSQDLIDIGFYGIYNLSGVKYGGLARFASDKRFKLFRDSTVQPTTTVTLANYGDLDIGGLGMNGNIAMNNNNITSANSIAATTFTGALTGNVTGSVSGSAATVTAAAQTAITTLANLVSVGGASINATQWGYIGALNQGLASSNSPSFVSVTANLTGSVTGNVSGSAATVTSAAQTAITTLANLSSVAGTSINSTKWGYLGGLDQPLATTSSPTFNTVTASLSGNATTATSATTAATVTTAAQTAITTLANLSSVSGVAISGTKWGYLGGLDQPLATTSSPTFNTVTASNGLYGTVATASQPNITTLPNLGLVGGTSINSTQWGYLGALNQSLTTSSSSSFAGLTINRNATSGSIASFLTGNISNFGSISLGRASAESEWGIAAIAGNYLADANIGDACIRVSDSSKALRLGVGGGLSLITMESNMTTAKGSINMAGVHPTNAWSCLMSPTNTVTNSGFQYGFVNTTLFNPTGGAAADVRAISSQATYRANAGQTINRVCGYYCNNAFTDNSGTVNTAIGLYVDQGGPTVGTITNSFGAYIETPQYGTNKTALYVNGVSKFASQNAVAQFIGGSSGAGCFLEFYRSTPATRTGYIGHSQASDDFYIQSQNGQMNLQFTAVGNAANLQITAGGFLSRPVSSARYKSNIQDSKVDTSLIYNTVAKEFDYKEEYGGGHDVGYIAEDLDSLGLGNLVNYDGLGRPDSIKWDKFSFYLLEELKKLKARIEVLESQ